jgi:hypothetical protein
MLVQVNAGRNDVPQLESVLVLPIINRAALPCCTCIESSSAKISSNIHFPKLEISMATADHLL